MKKDFPNEAYDELTGLINKETFYKEAQEALENQKNREQGVAFVYFDVDNFKIYNENYGYTKGDELLRKIAGIICDDFEEQLVSRFSDDHFVVCTHTRQLVAHVTNIHLKVHQIQKNANLELKAGIYMPEEDVVDVVKCCDRARAACISIKKKYDVEYRFFDEELNGKLKKQQFVLDHLDEALENQYIQVYYQPVVRTVSGKICGWEALARWDDPVYGLVYPGDFVPILEEVRLIHKLDMYVIETAMSDYPRIIEARGETEPISINLSRIDFELYDIFQVVDDLRSQYRVPKDMIHFEITEGVLMDDPDFIREQIHQFKENGYQIWMDDFGSGYSSLNVLQKFDFYLIKIDMKFMEDFENNSNSRIILSHMISMIKELGFHTLAEGVETQAQYDFLREIGCEKIQGYLIGAPMRFLECYDFSESKGLDFEQYEERSYYNTIGSLDVLRQNPLQNIKKHMAKKTLPLCIMEDRNGTWNFLVVNESYRELLKKLWNVEVKNAGDGITYGSWKEAENFKCICDRCRETGMLESMDSMENGYVVNIRASHIISDVNRNVHAYMVSLRLIDSFETDDKARKLEIASRFIFANFEIIDIIAMDGSFAQNLYYKSFSLYVDPKGKTVDQVLHEVAEVCIYPDDRSSYLHFSDIMTIRERMERSGSDVLTGFFRARMKNGTYGWKTCVLTLIQFEEREMALTCWSSTSPEVVKYLEKTFVQTQNTPVTQTANLVTHTDAFDNILDLLPVGIFWKDENRRFLGANRMFLDYYGMESLEDLLGRTDEDMGWHINPEPFRRDEMRVVKQGDVIRDILGTCIVNGEVRDIRATKKPLYSRGRIVGLIGYFEDVTKEMEERDRWTRLSETDELTGVLNRRGLNDLILRYQSQYEMSSMDFAIFMVDLDNFKYINDRYGHDFGDKVLIQVCSNLKAISREKSVVIRYGGDEFVILHQFTDSAEVKSLEQEIQIAIERITKVDDIPVKVAGSVGVACYSEEESISGIIEAADQRMYINKKLRKLNRQE